MKDQRRGRKKIKLRYMRTFVWLLLPSLLLSAVSCNSDKSVRKEIDLSGSGWYLWLDKDAGWKEDSLYLPPVNIESVPVHVPTCGWDELERNPGKEIEVPATVEEHFWQDNGISDFSGDYTGVSWFVKKVFIPENFKNKRLILDFESVRLRAEVFVNRKLAGYDVIGNTPFQIDVSKEIIPGDTNLVAIRITDPSGNFSWEDFDPHTWGKKLIPPSHGFGGITGKVKLIATDLTYIDNVFIKNKPEITSVDVMVTMKTDEKKIPAGDIYLELMEKESGKTVWKGKKESLDLTKNLVVQIPVELNNARVWSLENPDLYILKTRWLGEDGSTDQVENTFGFRWFSIKDINGDKQLFLNNERKFLLSAIHFGYYPENGIFPKGNMARKNVQMAKDFGLNMLNFHRIIGRPEVFQAADEMGLLLYEEPGGYLSGERNEFIDKWRREKFRRMVLRDRNHPSLIMYSMQNEACHDPVKQDYENIRFFHQLDPTRIITFSSNTFYWDPPDAPFVKKYNGKCPEYPAEAKLHYLPYDTAFHHQGWWDEHHAIGPGSYTDTLHYTSPDDYYLYTNHSEEVIFYGEEGAIGVPARVELIKKHYENKNGNLGYDGEHFLRLYDTYEDLLTKHGFSKAFQSVDELCTSIGNVALYYQGRAIENARINNTIDGYVINAWENPRDGFYSGIVDVHRNPKGNMELISYYNQPLYVAVKLPRKVLGIKDTLEADFFVVNKNKIEGDFTLQVKATSGTKIIFEQEVSTASVVGGNTYGQLLVENVRIPVQENNGYINISAALKNKQGNVVASGKEHAFVVDLSAAWGLKIDIISGREALVDFIKKNTDWKMNLNPPKFQGDVLLLDQHVNINVQQVKQCLKTGGRIIIFSDVEKWSQLLSNAGIMPACKQEKIWGAWIGGHYLIKEHEVFNNLPVNTAMNWEYQALIGANTDKKLMRHEGGNIIVSALNGEEAYIGSALSEFSYENGKIIVSSLDLLSKLDKNVGANLVPAQILLNLVEYASE